MADRCSWAEIALLKVNEVDKNKEWPEGAKIKTVEGRHPRRSGRPDHTGKSLPANAGMISAKKKAPVPPQCAVAETSSPILHFSVCS